MSDKITAYKAFKKDWTCCGFQFEVGKTYEHDGDVVTCESGFHACLNPMDCWSYYDITDCVFAEVTLDGEADDHDEDTKVAAAKITINAEIALPDVIRLAVNWVIEAAGEEASGYGSTLAASGYGSKLAASGSDSKLAASGSGSTLAASGYDSKAKAGKNGAICLAYHDGKRPRFAVGYVGEDGIEPDTWYRVKDGKLVEAGQ